MKQINIITMTVEKTKIPSKNADDADDFFFQMVG